MLALVSICSFSAVAQENGNRDENGKIVRGAYETNRAFDNWFVGAGAGVNGFFGKRIDMKLSGFDLDLNVGKWFTPSVGARVGYRGVKNAYADKYAKVSGNEKWNQHFMHADLLWNISNAISGYKETRIWDVIPYAQTGILRKTGGSGKAWAFGAGAGIINDFRICKHVDLFIDLSGIVTTNNDFGNKVGTRFAFLPSLSAGIVFNIGKSNFSRKTIVAPLPFTEADYEALKKANESLKNANKALADENEALKGRKPETVYVNVDNNVNPSSTFYFDMGKTSLSAREIAHLDYYIENVLKNSDKTFVITGSADKGTGSAKRNQFLSEKRAEFVKNYLVKNGISEDRLIVKAEGENNNRFSQPVLNRVAIIEQN